MMRPEFHPEALAEYEDAVDRYEKQKLGLGFKFIKAVEVAISKIVDTPDRWRVIDGGEIRRVLTRVFPCGVLYTIEADYVLIVAVAHCSRKPGYWKDLLN